MIFDVQTIVPCSLLYELLHTFTVGTIVDTIGNVFKPTMATTEAAKGSNYPKWVIFQGCGYCCTVQKAILLDLEALLNTTY